MPVYNSELYLAHTIESILSQSLNSFELILIDDGSTDGSSDICDSYAEKDNRIVVIHQKNTGICNARNESLKKAKGEYVAFCDHDDEYMPGLLLDNYKYCKDNDLDFCKFCKESIVLENGKEVERNNNKCTSQIYLKNEIITNIINFLEKRLASCVWDGLFKRQFLLENNIIFDSYYKMGGEDYAFVFKCFEYVKKFGVNGHIYYRHIIRKGFSTSTKKNPLSMEVQKRMILNMDNLLKSYGKVPSDIKKDYTFFYVMFYISPQVQNIISLFPSMKERLDEITKLRLESTKYDFLTKTRIPISKSLKYSIVHFLFYHGYNRILIWLYKLK